MNCCSGRAPGRGGRRWTRRSWTPVGRAGRRHRSLHMLVLFACCSDTTNGSRELLQARQDATRERRSTSASAKSCARRQRSAVAHWRPFRGLCSPKELCTKRLISAQVTATVEVITVAKTSPFKWGFGIGCGLLVAGLVLTVATVACCAPGRRPERRDDEPCRRGRVGEGLRWRVARTHSR